MKYVLVTGGVISGIGKGIISSSIGTLLKSAGFRVTSIKIDPYINIDAGTFSPYEHGEVFVLDDGGEVDLDLGNYERYLHITLHKDNNITTGKIYQLVINRERKGDYLGKTVQVVPHITDAVQEWVERVSKIPVDDSGMEPQICIIELGGVIGDIESMPFVEAFRQFQFRVKKDNFACVHVSLVPQPTTTGEQKTKPTQMSVRELRGLGLSPTLLVCRCNKPISQSAVEKLAMFCHVSEQQVVCIPDVKSLFRVPSMLEEQQVHSQLLNHFDLQVQCEDKQMRHFMYRWKELAKRQECGLSEIRIALVGKYIQLEDAYTSINKALQHASLMLNHRLIIDYISSEDLEEDSKKMNDLRYHQAWQKVASAHGVLVPGGFGPRGVQGKMDVIGWCRQRKRPFLGICLGMQCAVIEFARDVLKWDNANSTEFDADTQHPVIIDMPEHNPGQMGGTMRLGKRRTTFTTRDSMVRKLYGGVDYIEERHRHRYEVNPDLVDAIDTQGLHFTGRDGNRMEIVELQSHPFFVGVQFHPEYVSNPMKPSPLFMGLILAATGKLDAYLNNHCRLRSRSNSFMEEDEKSQIFQLADKLNTSMEQMSSSPLPTILSSSSFNTD